MFLYLYSIIFYSIAYIITQCYNMPKLHNWGLNPASVLEATVKQQIGEINTKNRDEKLT